MRFIVIQSQNSYAMELQFINITMMLNDDRLTVFWVKWFWIEKLLYIRMQRVPTAKQPLANSLSELNFSVFSRQNSPRIGINH